MGKINPNGLVWYHLRFDFAPEQDSDDFQSIRRYAVGDELGYREGLPNANCLWQVAWIEDRYAGGPHVLHCELVVTA